MFYQSISFSPLSQRCSKQWLVESMDVDARVIEPAADASLFALSVSTLAGEVGQPASKIDFTCLKQRHDHPQASGQMGLVHPRAGLPQPSLQCIVERRVFFTVLFSLEWFLV